MREATQVDGTWLAVTAMAGLDDALYVMSERALYRVDARGHDGLGDDAWESRLLAGVGGALVAIEPDGKMYRIDPHDGSWRQLAGEWPTAFAATASAGKLYVIERSGTLYDVDPETGSYTEVDTGYQHTAHLVGARGEVFTIDDEGALWRGADRLPEAWSGVVAAAGDPRGLYLATRDAIFAVDPQTGAGTTLLEHGWRPPFLLAAAAGALWVQDGEGLFRIDL